MDSKNLLKDSKAYYEDNDYYEIFSVAEDGENKVANYLKDICKDKIVLDAGCGTGKFLNILEEYSKKYNPPPRPPKGKSSHNDKIKIH